MGHLARLERLLDRAAKRSRQLLDRRRPAEVVRQALAGAAQGQRPLLKVARYVQRPALVAKVTLELAEDGGRGKASELVASAGLKALDRTEESQARHLDEVVDRLVGVAVA